MLLTLISAGTAFASDINETDVIASDVEVTALQDTSYEDETSLSDSDVPSNSFTALSDLITDLNESSTLTLTQDYLYNSTVDANYSMGMVVDKAITIDGAGYTIDANASARIFNVTADNVIIKNVVFTNGYCYDGTGQAGCVL